MKTLTLYIFSVLSTCWLSGCGNDEESESTPPRNITTLELTEHETVDYSLADPACQERDGENGLQIESAWLYRWQETTVERSQSDLDGLTMSENSLVSPAISLTTYAGLFERECDFANGREEACLRPDGKERGYIPRGTQALRYCQSDTKYKRNTYEGIGLHAAQFVTQAHHAYEEFSETTELEKIQLEVLPNFTTYVDNYDLIAPNANNDRLRLKLNMTHNAMYLPGPKTIAVLPERKVDVENLKGFFWESPFVLAHEYGHHIEFELRGHNQLAALSLQWNPLTHSYEDLDPTYLTASGYSARALLAGTFSEAFADLLAYYAADGHSSSLVGLECFGPNRDVGRSDFVDGTSKHLTSERVQMLLTGNGTDSGANCAPDFSDIHYQGAVLTYTLDQSFQQVIQAAGIELESRDDYKERYRLAISWMRNASSNLTTLVAEDVAPEALHQAAASGLADAITEWLPGFSLTPETDASTVKEQVCELVAELWPAVDQPPFVAEQGCQAAL